MVTRKLENLLVLLALVILIDKKVYREEVEVFASAAATLSAELDPGLFFTEGMAADWFRENRRRLEEKLGHKDKNDLIDKALKNFDEFPRIKKVFFSMIRIAHADNEYHETEHAMIKRAADRWKLSYTAAGPG